jgi:uncharacterized membrane protein YbjE (DUF340 family)
MKEEAYEHYEHVHYIIVVSLLFNIMTSKAFMYSYYNSLCLLVLTLVIFIIVLTYFTLGHPHPAEEVALPLLVDLCA